jgi:hypothetical protein
MRLLCFSLSGEVLAQDGGRFLPTFNHRNWKDAEGGTTGTQPYAHSVTSTQWTRARNDAVTCPGSNAWVRAMHLALLPPPLAGRVLIFDGNEGSEPDGNQFWSIMNPDPSVPLTDNDKFWNFELQVPSYQGRGADFGCSGHSWTPDLQLVVSGGTSQVSPFIIGTPYLYTFDPAQPPGNAMWVRWDDMDLDRWYPGETYFYDAALNKRRMLSTGGRAPQAPQVLDNDTYEAWDPASNAWATWGAAQNRLFRGPYKWSQQTFQPTLPFLHFYPRIHQLTNGELLRTGYDVACAALFHVDGTSAGDAVWSDRRSASPAGVTKRYDGASVVHPNVDPAHTDSVVALGGQEPNPDHVGNPTVEPPALIHDSVEMVKGTATASGAWPNGWNWHALPSMNTPRTDFNAVLLPDASLMVFGGITTFQYVVPPPPASPYWQPVPTLSNERFTSLWTEMAPLPAVNGSVRDYHSTAMLLPDGRVLLAGGDGRCYDYQIYEPPYLTNGQPRPQFVTYPPQSLAYDTLYTFEYAIAAGASIDRIVLMRPGSTTHHSDFDQRFVRLPIELLPLEPPSMKTFVQFRAPKSPPSQSTVHHTNAPQGWWMLFLVSDDGVPSVAHWVNLP